MDAKKVTWFEMNRTNSGTPAVTAYAENEPAYTHYCTTISDLKEWCDNFPNAAMITVADTTKNIPKCPDYSENLFSGIIPFAKELTLKNTMKTQGQYRKGFPEGMIVHFTAGSGNGRDVSEYIASQGYATLVIDEEGQLFQSFNAKYWGYHCGTYHQETHIGVEIINGGRLHKNSDGKFYTWFEKEIPESNVRYFKGGSEQIEGYYQKYTEKQEDTLIKLCHYLYDNGKGVFKMENVIGHDEACCRSPRGKGAKNDPGGSLSLSMPDFRSLIMN